MAEWDIGGPGKTEDGDKSPDHYVSSFHVGHQLVYGTPVEGERPGRDGKPYTVAHCDWVVCLTEKRAWTDVDVGGARLAPGLLNAGRNVVTFRLNQGEVTQEGRNPVLLPEDPLPVEIEDVQKLLDKYAMQYPTGRVALDVVQYNRDNAPPAEQKF
jgi:hypothetical protein